MSTRDDGVARQHLTCFVIMAFGTKGTPESLASEHVYKDMISPVLREFGYDPVRADEIPHPGSITRQIVDLLQHSALVIADLTHANPNVYYELGVRHSFVRSGTILIAQDGEHLPFDVANYRVLFYSTGAPADFAAQLTSRLRGLRDRRASPDSPVHDFFSALGHHDVNDPAAFHCACDQEVAKLKESLTKVLARTAREYDCRLRLRVARDIFNAVDAPDAPFNDAIREVRIQLAVREGFVLPRIELIEDPDLRPGLVVLTEGDRELFSARHPSSEAFIVAQTGLTLGAQSKAVPHPLAGTPLLKIKRQSAQHAVATGAHLIPISQIVAAEVGRVCLKARDSLERRRSSRA